MASAPTLVAALLMRKSRCRQRKQWQLSGILIVPAICSGRLKGFYGNGRS